jgi:hypothetical protein
MTAVLYCPTGTEGKPTADRTSEVQKWESKGAEAQFYVVTTVDSSITPHIMMCTTSNKCWIS